MFVFLYISYARLINHRLGNGSLRTSSSIFASPKLLATGEQISPAQLIAHLQRASYTEAADNKTGHYARTSEGIEIVNGTESYFQPHNVLLQFSVRRR